MCHRAINPWTTPGTARYSASVPAAARRSAESPFIAKWVELCSDGEAGSDIVERFGSQAPHTGSHGRRWQGSAPEPTHVSRSEEISRRARSSTGRRLVRYRRTDSRELVHRGEALIAAARATPAARFAPAESPKMTSRMDLHRSTLPVC